AVLFAWLGERDCPRCGAPLARVGASREIAAGHRGGMWQCPNCDFSAPLPAPRHFSSSVYAAVCKTCHGVGSLRRPNPDKLIIHPERPICEGAMYSPGFFPKGYLCKPMNGGYEVVQALAAHFGFDPATTPWDQMSPEAQHAFLFGYPEKLRVVHQSRNGTTSEHWWEHPGFYGWIRDWDVGGTYTDATLCPDCHGARLRPEYASVTLAGHTLHELSEMTLAQVDELRMTNDELRVPHPATGYPHLQLLASSLNTIQQRLHFLLQVGLGYLHLNRDSATLSAGEAQRVKLAGLLGSGLTSLTVLVDEPSRGMHPAEIDALIGALHALRDEGNTVIVVEHDPAIIRAADYLVDVGPGAGVAGGEIVAAGPPDEVLQMDTLTARWMRDARESRGRPQIAPKHHESRGQPQGWLTIRGARAHNLRGEEVRLPLGCLVGICGVSGSGKSTLLIDTLGRALAPKKITTSVAYEPVEPGEYDTIEGAPARVILVDQVKAGVTNPATFLGLIKPLHALYAESEDAQALGLDEKTLSRHCSVCRGSGSIRMDMGFLPTVYTMCEACHGTGFVPEAWDVRLHGIALPEVFGMTLDEVYALFGDEDKLARPLQAARDVGLGYLVLRQPGYALSGGEAQRLKIAKELCRRTRADTLYILDEPTVGQHLEDVARLNGVLHRLVAEGHSVFVVEHHTYMLAACDWLVELGPGGGPEGGHIIAQGPPEVVVYGDTPTARYLREVLLNV
ncbi:MAG: ATP-binding cassette domain-containing protein, partial [Anaerolineae bacterium]|nr:ATP-binding cassette domain-containing protein [Anaerolineae bacterium]